jgi:hypothetical protein
MPTKKERSQLTDQLSAKRRYIAGEHLREIYDWSRSYAHHLSNQGLIRAVLLKGPNSKRGRKLYEVESIEAFLKSCEYRPRPCKGRPKKLSRPICRKEAIAS